MATEGGRVARNRVEGFVRIVSDNFKRGDLHVRCSYRRNELSGVEADRKMRRFIRSISEMLDIEGLGPDQVHWICVTVYRSAHDDLEMRGRHMHHLLLGGVPMTLRDDIASLWSDGECCTEVIMDSPEELARHMAMKFGDQSCVCKYGMSRNIKRTKRSYAYRDTKIGG